jgi:hypothetical protein
VGTQSLGEVWIFLVSISDRTESLQDFHVR